MGYYKDWPHVEHETSTGFTRGLTLTLCNIRMNLLKNLINVNHPLLNISRFIWRF